MTSRPPLVVRRPVLLAGAALLVAATATGCSDDDTEPGIIDATAVDERLQPAEDVEPEPGGPCDMESHSVLSGVDASDLRAWTRVVDGHPETVVVGRWPLDRPTAVDRFQRLGTAREACRTSPEGEDYLLELISQGSLGTGFSARRVRGTPSTDEDRLYTWVARPGADDDAGYVVTAWVERTDGSRTTPDLRAFVDAQVEEIEGSG